MIAVGSSVPLPVWHTVSFMQSLYIESSGSYGAMPQVRCVH
jgi:hypothetical protein